MDFLAAIYETILLSVMSSWTHESESERERERDLNENGISVDAL